MMFSPRLRPASMRSACREHKRWLSRLPGHPDIYVFPRDGLSGHSHLLTFLSTEPPTPDLAIGSTSQLPPTPDSFIENPKFLPILHEVLAEQACHDPAVMSQAAAMASTAGSTLGSGGSFFPRPGRRGPRGSGGQGAAGDGAGAASIQGGAGGGGVGGWIRSTRTDVQYIHVGDERHIPEYGRIAEPQDIFGSLEVDGQGRFVDGHGRYQPSGTYRMVTRKGILGLSPFLRAKLVQRLSALESSGKS